MANIINNNFHNLKLKIYKNNYWDFFISKSLYENYYINNNGILDLDISNNECLDGEELIGISSWNCAYYDENNNEVNDVGYTFYDNGFFLFEKDSITNKEFIELYTNHKPYIINDKNIHFKKVSGSTQQYEYPLTVIDDKVKLNGGFFQAFFKIDKKYQSFPDKLDNGDMWVFEFQLEKCEFEKENKNKPILNDKYPLNKGIFFYIGTRAENKWFYLYENEDEIKDNNPCILSGMTDNDFYYDEDEDYFDLSMNDNDFEVFDDVIFEDECDKNIDSEYVEDEVDISDFGHETEGGVKINKYEDVIESNNKFLLMNRTETGFTVNTINDNDYLRIVSEKKKFNKNLFLLMNRTETGFTVNTINDEINKEENKEKYNIYKDIVENALAFRITDKGEIGYRYIITNCENENQYEIIEAYSNENIIKNNEKCLITIKIYAFEYTMKIYFYVNDNLVFVSKEIPKLKLRQLHELEEKQVGVPYNMSIGGGTQGLAETIMPNYMFIPNKVFPLEENFAGSFIGYFYKFKFYNSFIDYNTIKNNYEKMLK